MQPMGEQRTSAHAALASFITYGHTMWFAHQIILISRNHSRANNATDYHFISSNLNQNCQDKYQPLKVDYKLKDLNFIPQESYKLDTAIWLRGLNALIIKNVFSINFKILKNSETKFWLCIPTCYDLSFVVRKYFLRFVQKRQENVLWKTIL